VQVSGIQDGLMCTHTHTQKRTHTYTKRRSDQVFPKAKNGTFSSTRGGSPAARSTRLPGGSRRARPAAHCHHSTCLHTAKRRRSGGIRFGSIHHCAGCKGHGCTWLHTVCNRPHQHTQRSPPIADVVDCVAHSNTIRRAAKTPGSAAYMST
jgi:hypothetical protein